MFIIRRGRHDFGERGEIAYPAGRLEIAVLFELIGQRNEVDGHVRLVDRDHRLENIAVRFRIKIVLVQRREHVELNVPVYHKTAQNRLLRL